MTTTYESRIVALLTRGYSVDLICEVGVGRWLRADVFDVIDIRHWALDYAGRLQPQSLREASVELAPLKNHHPQRMPVEIACADRLIEAGIDHPVRKVYEMAKTADTAVEALRTELLFREEVNAALSASVTRSTSVLVRECREGAERASTASTGPGIVS